MARESVVSSRNKDVGLMTARMCQLTDDIAETGVVVVSVELRELCAATLVHVGC